MVWPRRTVLADPKPGPGLNPVHRENPRKPFFPRYLRGGRTSADGMHTATIITAFTYGLGSIESAASGRVTRTHSLTEEYKARCVPNSLIPSVSRKNSVFQPIFVRRRTSGRMGAAHQLGGGHRGNPVRGGRCRTGRPHLPWLRASPVAQVFNLCLSIAAASPARAIVEFE
jgi:hypothetical protein